MKPVCFRLRCKLRHFIGRQWQWLRSANSLSQPSPAQPGHISWVWSSSAGDWWSPGSWRVVSSATPGGFIWLFVEPSVRVVLPSIIWHSWVGSSWQQPGNNNNLTPRLCYVNINHLSHTNEATHSPSAVCQQLFNKYFNKPPLLSNIYLPNIL